MNSSVLTNSLEIRKIKEVKKIIHIDMDCFFAAVEMRDNPKLEKIPIAIGGSPTRRGILCTSNYEARKYGVKSAMSSVIAMKKCPKLQIITPNFQKYKEASEQVFEIFNKYSDQIQGVSLDEAYLDVTSVKSFNNSATIIAQHIRKEIKEKVGITASAGIAPNKFLAKIASDWNKPNNQFTINPNDIKGFVSKLNVSKLPGVGPVTLSKLNNLKIYKCSDLYSKGLPFLLDHFGKYGVRLYELSEGIDKSIVKNESVRKSLSVENTFSSDINYEEALEKIPNIYFEMIDRLKRYQLKTPDIEIKNIFLKIKTLDFNSHTIESAINSRDLDKMATEIKTKGIPKKLRYLLEANYQRENKLIRLLGLGVRFKSEDKEDLQLKLL